MTAKIDLLELSLPELEVLLNGWGQPAFRAGQLWQWIYRELSADFAGMSNLSCALRQLLAERAELLPYRELEVRESSDRETRKALLELSDGETIECVLMLYERRRTACLSTQVGCPIRCSFCATGEAGLRRNLSAGEIVLQALHLARWAAPLAPAGEHPLSNIVFMGMGEPLLNYDAVWRSIRSLTDELGFGLGARRFTISTAGVAPGIRRMAVEPEQVGLAISLHAPNDPLRDSLVPLNHRFPLAELLAAVDEYQRITGRRITYEYALIANVNDDPALARELAGLLQGRLAHVNLIPINPAPASPFHPPSRPRVQHFAETLEELNIPCTIRLRRGIDVGAGCGQLRSRKLCQES